MIYKGKDYYGNDVWGHELKQYPDGSLWIREENKGGYQETRVNAESVEEIEE